ncbi:midasin [Anabrus simplex]|uniref:midasin n=1 Tax=Anabrus simplex TaxID=316456 RepID=UPI0035A284F4
MTLKQQEYKETSFNCGQHKHKLSAALQVWPDLDPTHNKKQSLRVLYLLSSEGKKARRDLIAAVELLKTGSGRAVEEAQLIIDHVEKQVMSADLIDTSSDTGIPTSKVSLNDCAMVKLWPFQELLSLLLSAAFMREVFQFRMNENNGTPCENVNSSFPDSRIIDKSKQSNIARQLAVVLENLASIPPVFVGLARQHSVNTASDQQCVLELLMWHLKHNALSPARSFSQHWLTWNPAEDINNDSVAEVMNSMESSEDAFPLHCPLLTELVTGLTLKDCPSGSSSVADFVATSSLGSQQSSRHILRTLQELIWRNIATLTSPELDYKLNDAQCAAVVLQHLMQGLREALSDVDITREEVAHSPMEEIVSKLHSCISEMEEFPVLEVNHFTEALRKLAVAADSLKRDKNSELEILLLTGEIWTLLGYVQITLFSKFGTYDPVEKKALKLRYATEEHKDVARILYAHELHACLMGRSLDEYSDSNLHPLILLHRYRLNWLTDRKKILAQNVAFRPSDRPYFQELKKETQHYSGSLGSSEVVLGFHRRLLTACQDFISYFNQSQHVKQQEKDLSKAAEDVLREERSWRQSQIIFSERVSKTYGVWYPDLVTPFLSAVAQLCHGTSLLASVLNKLLLQLKLQSSEPMMFNLVRFPALGAGQESLLHLVKTCGDSALVQLLNFSHKFENKELCIRQEAYRLMQSALQELRNHTILQIGLDGDVWNKFAMLLTQVVAAWRKQEDERLAQEAEKDNLFVTKGGIRCKTISEEEEAAQEIEELFPTTMDEDFGDLQIQPTLESTPVTSKPEPQNAAVGLISSVDIQQICQLHFELVTSFSRSAWLAPVNSGVQPDFVTPLLLRYRTFRVILSVVSRGMSSTLDKRLAPSLILLTSLALNVGKSSEMSAELPLPGSPSRHSKTVFTKKTSDFYRDSNPGEVRQCLPLLGNVKQRVQELLDQWPDHPTLSQVMKILERIQDFPVTSPVARFLTGLELLLTKMQEWEENAHSGVSLAPHSAAVTHQIIAWRKLELQCWKDCLTNAALRAKANASHWWFHIYSLVESFTKPDTSQGTPMTEQDLIHSLQRFMEESTLGEFQARLEILYGFHCHTIHMEPSSRRDKLMSILWNLHGYYSQFSDGVNARIRELRLPIEKKLKDFVKIARWNDINYWAVKAAVEKTHKTLHKHVKEFEDVLKQPAIGALTNPKTESSNTEISEGLWDRPQRHQPRQYHHMLDPLHFVANSRLKRFITSDADKECKDMVLLPRAGSLFSRACKLSKETILASSYPRLMQTVDSFVTEIIETSNQLKNLEVSKDLSKEKQKSQAKSFLQQKRKALADLFRVLQQMGLSYRTGTALWSAEDNSVANFLLPPMDLKAAFQYLKNRRPDGQLLNVWDGCETYFLRSVARLALLNTALQNPSKDLGPPAIERCRGFAAHLMIVSREQKKKLAESSKLLCSLRCLIAQLTAMEENDDVLPRQSELQQSWKCLKELLVTSIVCLEQFRIFLQACPSGSMNDVEIPVLELKEGCYLPPMITATKNDEVWESSVKKVKNLILGITKLRTVIAKSETNIPFEYPEQDSDKGVGKRSVTERTGSASVVDSPSKLNTNVLITPYQYDLITEGFEQMEKYADELKSLQMMFESLSDRSPGDDNAVNPMVVSLHWLEHTIRQEVATFREKCAFFPKSSKQALRDETCNFSVSNEEEHEQTSDLLVSESTEMNGNETDKPNITDAVLHDQGKIVAEFSSKCEKLLKSVLIVIQNMYKKYTLLTEKSTDTKTSETESKGNVGDSHEEGQPDVEKSGDSEDEDSDKIEDGHMKERIVESISTDLDMLNMKAINSQLQNLIHNLVSILDIHNTAKEGNICKRLLLCCVPCLDQLVLLCQFFVTQQVAAYRVSCKMLSVLLSVFLDLAEKGFCVPPELAEGAEGDQTEGTQGGMGLGEGEGEKDVSETIESEDQLEDARPQGEERKEEERDCKEEEKGIETSEDFGGKVQDLEKKEGEGESEESGEEEELDKEMGETEEGADMLDQQIWGSDSEGEGSDDGGEEEDKKEDSGSGEKTGQQELGAKDEKDKYSPEDDDEKEDGKQEKQKKDIDEMKEPEMDEDHVDPYHGNQQPLPEPEPLDLPDDLQLDDGDAKDGQEDEENPFDIDAMKEKKPPEADDKAEEQESTEEKQESKKETEHTSSDEEEEEGGNDAEEAPGVKDPDDDEKMETEGPDENEDEVGGGGKDDEKEGIEPKETEKEEEKEDRNQLEAVPSDDRPSDAPAEAAPDMKGGSKDKVTPHPDQGPSKADEDMGSEGGDEAEGIGQAEAEEDKTGHRGQLPNQRDNLPSQNTQPEADQQPEKRRRPGETDSNRTLGDVTEPVKKKLKTIDLPQKDGQENEEMEEDEKEETEERKTDQNMNAEEYRHIKDAKETHDTQTLDAATKEQAEKQSVPKLEEEPAEDPSPDEKMELQKDEPPVPEEQDIPSQKSEKVPGKKKKEGDERNTGDIDAEGEVETRVEVEGESVPTLGAARGSETTYHTSHDKMMSDIIHIEDTDLDPVAVRNELEKQLATWAQPPPDDEAAKAWESFLSVTSSLARDLSEQLRLVLEPTQASRLRGDYRTGRRINMRKVIPYIASQFRKDKIWLRRTKPSKRDYQIVLAIDDSASMADNHSKELAFESLALVSRALTLLESGELSVVSFGEMVKVLHQLGDPFTEQSGARLLQQISFSQNGTRVAQLVEFVTTMFQMSKSRASHSSDLAQLLVIVSDGRGVFSESPNKVKLAIRQAREAHIFMVFIIVDNPDNQSSVLDIRTPVFKDGKLECFKPYLDSFPFPFYLILRDINALPGVLSDALRQWFELVTNMDNH